MSSLASGTSSSSSSCSAGNSSTLERWLKDKEHAIYIHQSGRYEVVLSKGGEGGAIEVLISGTKEPQHATRTCLDVSEMATAATQHLSPSASRGHLARTQTCTLPTPRR